MKRALVLALILLCAVILQINMESSLNKKEKIPATNKFISEYQKIPVMLFSTDQQKKKGNVLNAKPDSLDGE